MDTAVGQARARHDPRAVDRRRSARSGPHGRAAAASPRRRRSPRRPARRSPAARSLRVASRRAGARDDRASRATGASAGRARCRPRRTDDFDALLTKAARLRPAARSTGARGCARGGAETVGPARSFRVLPGRRQHRSASGSRSRRAPSQFGPMFDVLAEQAPDAFVWQGDLNYPDTVGPLAQTMTRLRRHLARVPRQPAHGAAARAQLPSPCSATTTTTACRTPTRRTSCRTASRRGRR